MNWNLVGSIYGRSSFRIADFVPICKHGCNRQFLFLVKFLKMFSSETILPNKATFYRKHLWKVLYKISSFHPDWTKNMVTMSNSCFWLAEILKILSSEARRHNRLLLCRNVVWEILYTISIFHADHTTNIAAIGSSCLW